MQWCVNRCIACLFGATRCRGETAGTFEARFSRWRFHLGAKKFALRRCVNAKARKSSPCKPKMAEKRCFQARWANYFAEMPLDGPRRANFFAEMPLEALCWATFVAVVLVVIAVSCPVRAVSLTQ